ncbi:protocatechuate 3,4-dioxygenase subunit alpha [Candidimonas sp. SYP-B2681]|uniref:protocatechuate 3,4-dioxygenase subunit alpha n=1 Tax=Candidimonas sp. SYP-B2681 TaxID=2497686 RepID=UPI000F8641AB|nr:protocatechuate 3,4-dioxygenase subunit alpha [Candidimonas sp. SYP-B2681]RTZ48025.1 protocatechuate 3,4-dioxygenase subunit alpha [Candidimonas sp. SYP-B2681]
MRQLRQTPSQTVGPFFAYGLCPQQYDYELTSLFTPAAAAFDAIGEHITIVGNVYDGNGQAVGDALIETLQANAEGRYVQSVQEAQTAGFTGFARSGTGTDPELRFIIDTIKPGCIDAVSAPHIDVIVMMRGMLLHAYTRLYFDDEQALNTTDPVLAAVPVTRRQTLIASRIDGISKPTYRFDIHLQGSAETVFFDL